MPIAAFALYGGLFGLAVVMGLLATTGSTVLVILMAALVASLVLVLSPNMLLWVVVGGGLVFAGIADLYFPEVRQARWGVVIAAVGLGFVSLGAAFWSKKASRDFVTLRVWSPITFWALLFFVSSMLSAFANLGFSIDTVIGLKGYFQVWGLMLAFCLLPLHKETPGRIMNLLFWIAMLQLPFVLHQHFVLVPQRSGLMDAARGIVAQDILVGTFSGSMTGGGAGPAMAVLLMVAQVAAIAKWRTQQLTTFRLCILSMIFMLPLAIGEHKIALVLLPVIFFLVFEDKVKRDPFKAVSLAVMSLLIMALLFVSFTMLPRVGGKQSMSPSEYLEQTLSYNVGDRGYGNSKLNRTTVYPFWLKNHLSGSSGFVHSIIGYGPGASKGALGGYSKQSLAEKKYPHYAIGLTGVSSLLWDVGVLGIISALGFFISAFRQVRKYAAQVGPTDRRWVNLKIAEAGIAMLAISLLHNSMFVYEIGFQTLLMILVGYVLFLKRITAMQSTQKGVGIGIQP